MKHRQILAIALALALLLGMMPAAQATSSVGANACDHKWGEWHTSPTVAGPTCTTGGTQIRVCEKCQQWENRQVGPLGHDFRNYRTTKEPTCTQAGERIYYCSRCQATKTEAVPALGHAPGSWTVTKQPTCTAEGVKETRCTRCGVKYTASVPAKGHSWGAWYVLTEPTDWEAGIMERKCQVCGATDHKPWYKDGTVLPEDRGDTMKHLQELLNAAGFDCGKADGIYGPKTKGAVEAAEQAAGHPATGIGWTGLIDWLEGGAKTEAQYVLKGLRAYFTGVERSESEHYKNGVAYFPGNKSKETIWLDAVPEHRTPISRFYTDPAETSDLTEDPTPGVPYYFFICVDNDIAEGDHSIDFSQIDPAQVNVTIDGYAVEYLGSEIQDPSFFGGYDGVCLYFKATYEGSAKTEAQYVLKGLTAYFTKVKRSEGDGYNDKGVAYFPADKSKDAIWLEAVPEHYTLYSRFHTDPAETSDLTEDPTPGVPYYFHITVKNDIAEGDHSIDFSQIDPAQVNVTIDGYAVEYLGSEIRDPSGSGGYDRVYLYFKATYEGGEDDDTPHPGVTLSITADPDAGKGKRYEGALVPFNVELENTGNWPVYVLHWSEWGNSKLIHDGTAPRDPVILHDFRFAGDNLCVLMNPGEKISWIQDWKVSEYHVTNGKISYKCAASYGWQYEEGGKFELESSGFESAIVDLTYPEGEEKTPKASLTLIYEGDCYWDGGDLPEIPTTEDTFDADDGVFANHTLINSGDVRLRVVRYYEAKGVVTGGEVMDYSFLKFDPGETDSDGIGYRGIGKIV